MLSYDTTKELLTVAFKNLRKRKIIARQNFLCCGGCAAAALGDKLEEEKNADKIGAVYFHRQDNERFTDAGILMLGYGARPGQGEERDKAIGRILVEELIKAGLTPKWNGSPWQRVEIECEEREY